MHLSIIIPTYNEEEYIEQCINTFKKHPTKLKYEIIVVDNNSSDSTTEIVSKYPGIKLVYEKKQGVAYAKNTAATHANGDYILFFDADSYIDEKFFPKLETHIKEDKSVFGGKCVFYDAPWLAKFITGNLSYYYWYFKFLRLFTGVSSLSGGCFIIQRELFMKYKHAESEHMDEKLLYPEDYEICKRLSEDKIYPELIKDLAFYTSFRRTKRSPLDGIRRLVHLVKINKE